MKREKEATAQRGTDRASFTACRLGIGMVPVHVCGTCDHRESGYLNICDRAELLNATDVDQPRTDPP